MSRHPDDDDEALRWDGDEVDHIAARPDTATAATADAIAPATGSALLVVYGIFAGAYLLFVVGWIIAVGQSSVSLGNLFFEIMYQFGEFLAIASPAIWLGTVLLLTRGARPVWRILWLLLGLVLVAPWPFILGAAS
ncbi:hypothetical protein FB562_0577 [Homoserinimonas aerilata]|uniref:DNA polymerase III subunit gamma/tau n=1 Tax=Homoserinimonas aerilata TaxID=1162970 RepID=A0A542YHR1_9MICO|nr:hypothetical protein [Homoserinimonas aerilata]TQL47514.1 hypothetical protein FB562_0577 [Homoserinimonas aerilata]